MGEGGSPVRLWPVPACYTGGSITGKEEVQSKQQSPVLNDMTLRLTYINTLTHLISLVDKSFSYMTQTLIYELHIFVSAAVANNFHNADVLRNQNLS